MWTYQATVAHVVDGDTFDLIVDVGFHVSVTERFRLARVDTPEIRGPERPDGLVSKQFVEDWFATAGSLTVRSSKTGKYGRWIGEVINGAGENLSDVLLAEGLAAPY